MNIKAIKTRLFYPPKDNLFSAITQSVKKIPEGSVLAIASKVVSIHQGRCILKTKVADKDDLIENEADKFLPREFVPRQAAVLTIKNNIFIPTSGIDESNANSHYILWPRQPQKAARDIWRFLRRKYKVKKIGVIIIDSHTAPLRRGVLGICLGFYGLEPIKDYRGTPDLFGRKLKISTSNIVDSLATAALVNIGEGNEQTPLALITDLPFVQFTGKPYRPKRNSSLAIPWDEDLYGPY